MIRFVLNNKSEFDCVLKIEDVFGTKEYMLSTLNGENYLDAEIHGDKFEPTLTPKDSDYKSVLEKIPTETFKEKVAAKFLGKVLSSEEKYFLLAECRYKVVGISDGQVIEIDPQFYACTKLPAPTVLNLLIYFQNKINKSSALYGRKSRKFIFADTKDFRFN